MHESRDCGIQLTTKLPSEATISTATQQRHTARDRRSTIDEASGEQVGAWAVLWSSGHRRRSAVNDIALTSGSR